MTAITLKNIPEQLLERLKARARAHRRSLNSEVICCLETVLQPTRLAAAARVERLRALRPRIDPEAIGTDELLAAVEQGRP
jgi:plasmid stability protein